MTTLSLLQSRLQHIYHGKPYARVDLTLCKSRLFVGDLGVDTFVQTFFHFSPLFSLILFLLRKREVSKEDIETDKNIQPRETSPLIRRYLKSQSSPTTWKEILYPFRPTLFIRMAP
jgi:hypothetical protein